MSKIDKSFYTEEYSVYDNLDICIEECGELIQACSKMKRSMGVGLATNVTQEYARSKIIEEISHVLMSIDSIKIQLDIGDIDIENEMIKAVIKAKANLANRRAEETNG